MTFPSVPDLGYHTVYRIRIGGYRAFFTFHIEIIDDTVMFQYLVSRGQAYTKKVEKELFKMYVIGVRHLRHVFVVLLLMCVCTAVDAQENRHNHEEDSTDIFFRHLQLNELTVTGVAGDTKLKHATAPVSIVTSQVLRSTASTNIIDAISHQPGVSQLTTGSGISKPIIRGLGYNRVVVMSDGVRQEGQQWGAERRRALRP